MLPSLALPPSADEHSSGAAACTRGSLPLPEARASRTPHARTRREELPEEAAACRHRPDPTFRPAGRSGHLVEVWPPRVQAGARLAVTRCRRRAGAPLAFAWSHERISGPSPANTRCRNGEAAPDCRRRSGHYPRDKPLTGHCSQQPRSHRDLAGSSQRSVRAWAARVERGDAHPPGREWPWTSGPPGFRLADWHCWCSEPPPGAAHRQANLSSGARAGWRKALATAKGLARQDSWAPAGRTPRWWERQAVAIATGLDIQNVHSARYTLRRRCGDLRRAPSVSARRTRQDPSVLAASSGDQ
jgi:hypothetical protein